MRFYNVDGWNVLQRHTRAISIGIWLASVYYFMHNYTMMSEWFIRQDEPGPTDTVREIKWETNSMAGLSFNLYNLFVWLRPHITKPKYTALQTLFELLNCSLQAIYTVNSNLTTSENCSNNFRRHKKQILEKEFNPTWNFSFHSRAYSVRAYFVWLKCEYFVQHFFFFSTQINEILIECIILLEWKWKRVWTNWTILWVK